MSLDKVHFHGVSPVHPEHKDLAVVMEFGEGFQSTPDDLVTLAPVGWKNLTQRRAALQPNGRTTVTFSSAHLKHSADVRDQTFQLLYVQGGVVIGASTPFAVGTPYDDSDESLSSNSLDSNTLLINYSSKGRGVSQTETNRQPGCRGNQIQTTSTYGRAEQTMSGRSGAAYNDRNPESMESCRASRTVNNIRTFDRSESEVSGSTDDESFVITEMPPSHAGFRSAESELQRVVAQLIRERDELSKLFRRERSIAMQQEKRNEDLQHAHDILAHENNELKEKLRQRESEIETLKKSIASQQASLGEDSQRDKKGIPVCLNMGYKDDQDASRCHDYQDLPDDFVCVIKRPPPYSPPCSLTVQSLVTTASLVGYAEGTTLIPTHGVETIKRVESRGIPMATVWNDVGSQSESGFCPMCAVTFEDADCTAFQRHVHNHFRDETSHFS